MVGKLYANLFDCIFLTHFFTSEVRIKIKIDKEYSSNWWDETKYLIEHGIKYTFVKEIIQEGQKLTVWKFKKNAKLFHTLANFYSNVYSK